MSFCINKTVIKMWSSALPKCNVLFNIKANEAKKNKKWIKRTLILQIQNKVGINISADDFLSIIHNVFFLTKEKWFNTIYHSYNGWSVKDAFQQVSSLAVPPFVIVIHKEKTHLLIHSNMLYPGRTTQHLDIYNTTTTSWLHVRVIN